jgi:hypothetical protein
LEALTSIFDITDGSCRNLGQSSTYKIALAQDVENNTIPVNNSKNSMLDELIYESSGKIVSQKVVNTGDIYDPSS